LKKHLFLGTPDHFTVDFRDICKFSKKSAF